MKPTKRMVSSALKRWGAKLLLGGWRVKWDFSDMESIAPPWAPPEDGWVVAAQTTWDVGNMKAHVLIARDAPWGDRLSLDDFDLVMGHELAHIVLAETGLPELVEEIDKVLEAHLTQDALKSLRMRLYAAQERVCDRIARVTQENKEDKNV